MSTHSQTQQYLLRNSFDFLIDFWLLILLQLLHALFPLFLSLLVGDDVETERLHWAFVPPSQGDHRVFKAVPSALEASASSHCGPFILSLLKAHLRAIAVPSLFSTPQQRQRAEIRRNELMCRTVADRSVTSVA